MTFRPMALTQYQVVRLGQLIEALNLLFINFVDSRGLGGFDQLLPNLTQFGNGCNTVVEHTPCDREVVDLNPAGCWAFSFIYLPSKVSLIRSLMEVQPN